MPLTEVARYIRNGIKWGIVALLAYIALRILFVVGVNYYNYLFPAPPPPPTVAFGKLPQIRVPGKNVDLANVEVILDNIEATPPATPKVLPVYRMPQPDPNLLKLDQAKKIAGALNFSTAPIPLSQTEYKFIDSLNPSLELIINIVTTNFYLRYDYNKDPSILNQPLLLNKDEAPAKFKELLGTTGMLFDDLKEGESRATYFKVSHQGDGKLKFDQVNSRLDANAVKVELFRKKIDDKYPFVQKEPQLSYVNALLIGDERVKDKKSLISVDFVYWPVDLKDSATYPLISSYTAWQSFLNGNGVVVEGAQKLNFLRVTDIYLAYWDPITYEEFSQPVFVITGKGTTLEGTEIPYTAYLPAVSAEYVIE